MFDVASFKVMESKVDLKMLTGSQIGDWALPGSELGEKKEAVSLSSSREVAAGRMCWSCARTIVAYSSTFSAIYENESLIELKFWTTAS